LIVLLWALLLFTAIFSAGHALLHKRDPRAALGWIAVCLAMPGAGAGLYWLFGVNRIRTRARDWQSRGQGMDWLPPGVCEWPSPADTLPFGRENYAALLGLADAVTRRPLVPGNRLVPLHNGEEAFPAMLEAISGAESFVYLSTYIFDSDSTGMKFVEALRQAATRGVRVRVLVDALGERYSFPPARRKLRKSKVRVVRFLPPSLSGRGINLNLRNHRKLLIVDGRVGFTGGMNIGDRHLAARTDNARRVIDLHFRIEGPVVSHLQDAFIEDWDFASGERLTPQPPPEVVGDEGAFCRGISAGPNEDFEKLGWIFIGALNCARSKVRIMTPYFIPDRALISAINAASLRGVKIEIILPRKNNLPYVGWASRAYLWEILRYGTQVHYQPPPFVHSKFMLVDDHYALIGSANLDPRSLRLNFEFNLEIYDRQFNARLADHFDAVLDRSDEISMAEVDGRPLPSKLLDATAKLFSPYL
jgi:cardiolipin synthase